ncbi:MAG: hypothetical protein ACKOWE_05140 [Micrococcales bacterium]
MKLNHLFPGTKYLHQSKLLTLPSPQFKDQAMIDYIWALLARVFPEQK